jgi:hypothetical protein
MPNPSLESQWRIEEGEPHKDGDRQSKSFASHAAPAAEGDVNTYLAGVDRWLTV